MLIAGIGEKPIDAVGAVFLDRVDVGCGDELVHLVPAAAHEAAHAAHLLVVAPRLGVLDDGGPGVHRRLGHLQRRAPALEQAAAHHRVLHAVGAVQVPAVLAPRCAAARLVVGHVGARARVVGLLGLPGDDAALDVDLPAARCRCSSRRACCARSCRGPSGCGRRPPRCGLRRWPRRGRRRSSPWAGEVGEAVEEMAHVGVRPCSSRAVVRR
jgi:hypothetical protein